MIYLDNNSQIQQVYIPRETLNVKVVTLITADQKAIATDKEWSLE